MISRTMVVGDIHGRANALKQVLALSKFDYEKDRLISLGDVCDGGEDTKGVIEELLKIKNLILVVGNHDLWAMWWMKTGDKHPVWYFQGGHNTSKSYGHDHTTIPIEHMECLRKSVPYYEEDDVIFIHGGFIKNTHPKDNTLELITWDRELIAHAYKEPIPMFKHIYVGHTTTQVFGKHPDIKDCMRPITFNNLTMMDCGAGWNGKLALMDIKTKEVWVSDIQKPIIEDFTDEMSI